MAAVAAAGAAAPDDAAASRMAIKRLHRDLAAMHKSPNPQIEVRPAQENMLEWHFVLHSLPDDTPYQHGCYHGKIVFPPQYPHAPPVIYMITPSGRMEVNKKLCLSMTDFHPESWCPAWSVETILVGLLSFFISNTERGYGSITESEEVRRRLAGESWAANAANAQFRELFPEYLSPPSAAAAAASSAAGGGASPGDAAADAAAAVGSEASPGAPAVAGGVAPAAGDLAAVVLVLDEAPAAPAPADVPAPPEGQPVSFTGREGGGGDGESEEEVPECWICRDNTSSEPLTHPCACRGSMSGVHASCVEQWVAHHRRNALNSEAPRCSVCHQQYSGREHRPGFCSFVRQMCCKITQQICRTFTLVGLLVAYQYATTEKDIPMPLRVAIIVAFSVVGAHKLAVLTASLPLNQAPPQNRVARLFFVGDQQQLGTHIAEAFATVMILGVWWLCGTLPLLGFLPFLIASIVPMAKGFRGCHPSLRCLKALGLALVIFLASPFLIVGFVISVIYRYPRQAAHPLGPGLHIVVAISLVPLCLTLKSNVPLLIIWGAHSSLVFLGLVERVLIKRWQWKEGIAWWFALQLTGLATYFASICTFPDGVGSPTYSDTIVFGVAFGWLCLVASLTLAVNWNLVVQAFRTWQARNGHFTLQAAGGGQAAPVGDAAV